MDDSACCLLPILKADGMWCPIVSRRFHSNKAWAVSLHCDDYKWHLKRPSAAFGSCGMLMDRKAMVKLRTRGEKPVRVALFSIFISGFLVNVVHGRSWSCPVSSCPHYKNNRVPNFFRFPL
jgi:hypothetical protein